MRIALSLALGLALAACGSDQSGTFEDGEGGEGSYNVDTENGVTPTVTMQYRTLVGSTPKLVVTLVARLLRSTLIRGPATPFVMELPPYRLPTLRGVLIHAPLHGAGCRFSKG